ncbi:hypothetical protein BH23PAT1_BH23PAT1_5340 [soil metagenome]
MPELLLRYKPGVVPGEYVERQVKRAPDIAARALHIDPAQICVESRKFEGSIIGYSDEEVGITSRTKTILRAARILEMEERGLSALRLEERHRDSELAGKWIGSAVLREWLVDPESHLYRLSADQPSHDTIVTVYPSDFAFVSSIELQAED